MGTARRAHGVVVAGEQSYVGMAKSFLRESSKVRELVRDVRPCEARAWHSESDGIVKVIPLRDVVRGGIGGRTIAVTKAVRLIADLEGQQARAEDALHSCGFARGICGRTLAQVETVEAAPSCRVEKSAQVAQRERRRGCPGFHSL